MIGAVYVVLFVPATFISMGRIIAYIYFCLLLAGLGIFCAYGQSSGESSNSNSINQFKTIDQYIEQRMRTAHIPGLALAIVKGDQSVYLKGYGRADPSGIPVTPQTSFIIGSVTKAFTAVAVMQLVEAGKVELDAPVTRYIPWFHTADIEESAQITVNQLLHQTSGLPMMRVPQLWTDQDDQALERTVRLLQTTKTEFPPGQSFGYSNANFEALGLIVQSVSGLSYEEYIRQHIFKPLDMQHSFVSQEEAIQQGMATGNRWWLGFPFPVQFPYNRSELPAGYLISSAEDMANFLVAQMNGGRYRDSVILSPNGIALTHTRSAVGTYCMGWESVLMNGRTVITHDGGTANFQSSVFFDPERRVGVFVTANVMCALDAFSSPPGSGPLDGTSVRAMAQSVLSMATNQPLPDQGRGIRNSVYYFRPGHTNADNHPHYFDHANFPAIQTIKRSGNYESVRLPFPHQADRNLTFCVAINFALYGTRDSSLESICHVSAGSGLLAGGHSCHRIS